MSKNISLKEKFSKKYPHDDDDAIYDRFNSFLSSLMKDFHLNSSDIEKLCEMFKKGATFEQIKQMAMSLYREHQEREAIACQRIADEKAGGVGEYHGFMGKNNPKRDITPEEIKQVIRELKQQHEEKHGYDYER